MSRRVMTFRLPEQLVESVDAVRGDVTRTRFVERALEKALEVSGAPSGLVTAGSAKTVPAPSRVPLRANYGALGTELAPGPSEVVERLESAQERVSENKQNRFRCGCATSATSHKARCPRHGRSLI